MNKELEKTFEKCEKVMDRIHEKALRETKTYVPFRQIVSRDMLIGNFEHYLSFNYKSLPIPHLIPIHLKQLWAHSVDLFVSNLLAGLIEWKVYDNKEEAIKVIEEIGEPLRDASIEDIKKIATQIIENAKDKETIDRLLPVKEDLKKLEG